MGSVNPWVGSTHGFCQPMDFVNPWVWFNPPNPWVESTHELGKPMGWVGLGLTFSLSRGLGLVGTDFCANNNDAIRS